MLRKSSYSNSQGQCVMVGQSAGIVVRDSKAPGILSFSRDTWTRFTRELKEGP